ncbi:hypothetical protein FGB62_223g027 [Gracilaria domingensis]|nr:hypothetical protein FGB62_223g027 [Gracilaria domingensis]
MRGLVAMRALWSKRHGGRGGRRREPACFETVIAGVSVGKRVLRRRTLLLFGASATAAHVGADANGEQNERAKQENGPRYDSDVIENGTPSGLVRVEEDVLAWAGGLQREDDDAVHQGGARVQRGVEEDVARKQRLGDGHVGDGHVGRRRRAAGEERFVRRGRR